MNRRDFVKALAGIPLLGLLAKLPEAEERTLPFVDSGLYKTAYAELQAGAEEQPPYELTNGSVVVLDKDSLWSAALSRDAPIIPFAWEDFPQARTSSELVVTVHGAEVAQQLNAIPRGGLVKLILEAFSISCIGHLYWESTMTPNIGFIESTYRLCLTEEPIIIEN